MNYPTIAEYVEAIRLAEENLDQLNYLRPVLDDNGDPVMSSGNFAVVFKMQDDSGKFYALKCFTRDQEGRAEAYKIITEELAKIVSPYFVQTEYYDKELFVDTAQSPETEFPVLLMDWVEGKNLSQYIASVKSSIGALYYNLYELSFKFNQFAQWMVEQPFAHGDLKPDNILITNDGYIIIVDYDGMYFPQMRGQQARDLGSPDYRHPNRTINDFDEHIDDFALASIALSLNAIASNNGLLAQISTDKLLLTENDYRYISRSSIFQLLLDNSQSNKELGCYIASFLLSLNGIYLEKTHFDFSDLYLSYVDENGVLTRKHVLWLGLNKHECVKIPNCVSAIGDGSFTRALMRSVYIPNSVISIHSSAFLHCKNLTMAKIPNSVTSIGHGAFCGCKGLLNVTIPSSVTSICRMAFKNCIGLTNLTIPNTVTSIDRCAFFGCSGLKTISIPNSVATIGVNSFWGCSSLTNLILPYSLKEIGNSAFERCSGLEVIYLPNTIEKIGYGAFNFDEIDFCNNEFHKSHLSKIIIPKGAKEKFMRMLDENLHKFLVEE